MPTIREGAELIDLEKLEALKKREYRRGQESVRPESNHLILFLVSLSEHNHVITWAYHREDAKRRCRSWLGANPDNYAVTPLTEPGDRVHLDITLNV